MNNTSESTVDANSLHIEEIKQNELKIQKELESLLKMQNDTIPPSNSGNTEIVITHIPPDSHD
jgi:hypothetical protein